MHFGSTPRFLTPALPPARFAGVDRSARSGSAASCARLPYSLTVAVFEDQHHRRRGGRCAGGGR
ncbi:MAG: hypothetical protein MZV64_62415 [Ignavibacteriales bacterium]|nr:hypothetical protein [Ignavibacteriales bacterium]